MQTTITADNSYQFIPPAFGRFMPMMLPYVFPFYLRLKDRIESIEYAGEAHLRESLRLGHRIILAPNHSRQYDPMLLGLVSQRLKQPFFWMTSWQKFRTNKFYAWIIRQVGGFSVFREGCDRQALKAAVKLLTSGGRPLVIFPEGEVSRTNDHLCPFMKGLSFIIKTALLKEKNGSKVVVHPVAIKYVLSHPSTASLHQALDDIEDHFHWPRSHANLLKRIVIVGKNMLTLKEMEYLGVTQTGELSERIHSMKEHILCQLEDEWLSGKPRSSFMSRVNSLRAAILHQQDISKRERDALDKIEWAVRLSNYPHDYLRHNPTLERMTETVKRLEEDSLRRERKHGRWKARIEIGAGLEVNPDDPSLKVIAEKVHERLQTILGTI